jgi:hypothetical protein
MTGGMMASAVPRHFRLVEGKHNAQRLKYHTTFRRNSDGTVKFLELSICRVSCPDFAVDLKEGAHLYRVSGDTLQDTSLEYDA